MDRIYIITWTGRDSDSGVWDTYPCFDYGFFTEILEVYEFVTKLNQEHGYKYNKNEDECEYYSFGTIEKHKGEHNDKKEKFNNTRN